MLISNPEFFQIFLKSTVKPRTVKKLDKRDPDCRREE